MAAAADSDRKMQTGTRMKRVFRSMFVVCKRNSNGSACFQEIVFGGQQTDQQTMALYHRAGNI
jgi:hypothetical protein